MFISEKERQIRLQEYIQANEMVRHYTGVCWTIFAIFFPVSIGLLGLSYTIEETPIASTMILGIASITLYLIWAFIDWRYTWYNRIIFERIRELESMLNMKLHREIDKRDKNKVREPYKPPPTRIILRIFMFVILVGLWILRIKFPL